MRLVRLIRYRYPTTAIAAVFVAAAVAMLWFPPVRKAGDVMLAALGVGVVSVAIQHMTRKMSR